MFSWLSNIIMLLHGITNKIKWDNVYKSLATLWVFIKSYLESSMGIKGIYPVNFFFFGGSTLLAHGSSQARGQIRAATAGLCHSQSNVAHGNRGSLTYWAGPGIEPSFSWIHHWATMGTPVLWINSAACIYWATTQSLHISEQKNYT